MGKLPKPYIKCERRGHEYHLTLMGSGVRGHVLLGRETVPVGDLSLLGKKAKEMVEKGRAPVKP